MRFRAGVLVPLLTAALVLAGCTGGSDAGDPPPGIGIGAGPIGQGPATIEDSTEPTEGPTGPTEEPTQDTGGGIIGDQGTCMTVASAYGSVSGLLMQALYAGDLTGDFDAAPVLVAVDQAIEVLPAELAPTFQALGEAVRSVDGQPVVDAQKVVDDPVMSTAMRQVEDWVATHCNGG
ncbi:hypothetical protein GIS00_05985 [Nakamurella sp. YIM 132087]|uniref:Uncharacterized protein n=1 Tax=Nakamurella alba TaxID=2665158 RepID=A0A7K1FH98_9ACTN|nr:hypothetical protein [Nakamurella alba]MTD13492.1 hypothetical protein [Nakamurella alba]